MSILPSLKCCILKFGELFIRLSQVDKKVSMIGKCYKEETQKKDSPHTIKVKQQIFFFCSKIISKLDRIPHREPHHKD